MLSHFDFGVTCQGGAVEQVEGAHEGVYDELRGSRQDLVILVSL